MAKKHAAKRAAARGAKTKESRARQKRAFTSPMTVTLPDMLAGGNDLAFRETIYLMVLAFGRLHSCREAFGRALSLTASQFIVLIGTAHRQGNDGITIRALADHTQLAALLPSGFDVHDGVDAQPVSILRVVTRQVRIQNRLPAKEVLRWLWHDRARDAFVDARPPMQHTRERRDDARCGQRIPVMKVRIDDREIEILHAVENACGLDHMA